MRPDDIEILANSLRIMSNDVLGYDPILGNTMLDASETLLKSEREYFELAKMAERLYDALCEQALSADYKALPRLNEVLSAYEEYSGMVTFGSA